MLGLSSMERSFNVVTNAATEAYVTSFRVSRAPSCATKNGFVFRSVNSASVSDATHPVIKAVAQVQVTYMN